MADKTLASLTAATPATGGLLYGTQGGADRKFTLTAAGAELVESATAAEQRTTLGLGALSTQNSITPGSTATTGASAGDILTSDGSVVQKITPGSGASIALGNAVNASGGLLTYDIIGTNGTALPLLSTPNTFSASQTFHAGVSYGDTIARFENNSGVGITLRTSTNTDFSGAFVGAPMLAFDFDNFFVKGSIYLPSPGAAIYIGQINMTTSGSGFIFQTGGSTAVAGTHIRLGQDSTYQGNFVLHAGDNTPVFTVTPGGVMTASGGAAIGSTGTHHSNIKSGVATLSAGTVTISDADVLETGTASTSSRIFVTRMTDGGTMGDSYSITRSNNTSFTITSMSGGSAQNADTSTVSWMLLNP